jgi:hypothetical protein
MTIKGLIWKSVIAGSCGTIVHFLFMYFRTRSGVLPSFQPYQAFQFALSQWEPTRYAQRSGTTTRRRHGRATWRDIDRKLSQGVSCPKLKSYWHFHGCRYEKGSRTCAEPEHIGACPLAACTRRPPDRRCPGSSELPTANRTPCRAMTCGMATSTRPPYSLFLFIREDRRPAAGRPTVRLAVAGCLEWRRR